MAACWMIYIDHYMMRPSFAGVHRRDIDRVVPGAQAASRSSSVSVPPGRNTPVSMNSALARRSGASHHGVAVDGAVDAGYRRGVRARDAAARPQHLAAAFLVARDRFDVPQSATGHCAWQMPKRLPLRCSTEIASGIRAHSAAAARAASRSAASPRVPSRRRSGARPRQGASRPRARAAACLRDCRAPRGTTARRAAPRSRASRVRDRSGRPC